MLEEGRIISAPGLCILGLIKGCTSEQSSAQSWIVQQLEFIILGGKTQALEEIACVPQEK